MNKSMQLPECSTPKEGKGNWFNFQPLKRMPPSEAVVREKMSRASNL